MCLPACVCARACVSLSCGLDTTGVVSRGWAGGGAHVVRPGRSSSSRPRALAPFLISRALPPLFVSEGSACTVVTRPGAHPPLAPRTPRQVRPGVRAPGQDGSLYIHSSPSTASARPLALSPSRPPALLPAHARIPPMRL